MSKAYLHHLLIAVDDLERARKFYTDVLEMLEIDRPSFPYASVTK
jgi:catechol 2,3-dioxygenase-like lactoylglutathione lyase family enzyme